MRGLNVNNLIKIILSLTGVVMLIYVFIAMAVPFAESLMKTKVHGVEISVGDSYMPSISFGNIATIVPKAIMGFLGIAAACLPGFLLIYAATKFPNTVMPAPELQEIPESAQEIPKPVFRAPREMISGLPEVAALRSLDSKVIYL